MRLRKSASSIGFPQPIELGTQGPFGQRNLSWLRSPATTDGIASSASPPDKKPRKRDPNLGKVLSTLTDPGSEAEIRTITP